MSAGLLLVVLLLPDIATPVSGPSVITASHGRIAALLDPHRPDPSGSGVGFLPDARVLLLDGPRANQDVEAYLQGPGGQQDADTYKVGEDVVVTFTRTSEGSETVAVSDRWRLPQLLWLGVVFVAAVVLVGGWRGVRALLALALTVALILRVLIPLLVNGVPPIPVAIALATMITILAIVLTEGFSAASVAAILGTAGALALTALLAAVVTSVAGFTNTVGSELVYLQLPDGSGLDLRGLLLAAFMIGAIGVLDDVTVTQASAVEQLRHQAGLGGRRLYASAFAVGRSHIAATVNTLFLAYAGAGLPLLVFFAVGGQPTTMLLNGEAVSIEIVRTLVGSLGIVAAVPLTTVIAVWITGGTHAAEPVRATDEAVVGPLARLRRPPVALLAGLLAVATVTLVATVAVSPLLGSAPRRPLGQDQFAGNPPSLAPSASPSPSSAVEASGSPPASADITPIFRDRRPDSACRRSGHDRPCDRRRERRPSCARRGWRHRSRRVQLLGRPRTQCRPDSVGGVARGGRGGCRAAPGRQARPRCRDTGGRRIARWVARFDVPSAADTLLLAYRFFGTTLFTVQLY